MIYPESLDSKHSKPHILSRIKCLVQGAKKGFREGIEEGEAATDADLRSSIEITLTMYCGMLSVYQSEREPSEYDKGCRNICKQIVGSLETILDPEKRIYKVRSKPM